MIACIVRLWQWFLSFFRAVPTGWKTVRIEDVPLMPEKNVMYLVGEGNYLWFVVFLCPCDCGELIQLNLLADASPRWHVTVHVDGSVTLAPSVWRTKGCGSHFFFRNGAVLWC